VKELRVLESHVGQSAIDDLNMDPRVVYAYPVFLNPNTGKRVFLTMKSSSVSINRPLTHRAPLTPHWV
jgi:hypothetical protein